jgi:FkbM family methyltransferase
MKTAPTAYDIGMHVGEDTEYFLKKGYKVIAVEANPTLCAAAAERFAADITAKRLTLHNLAIAERAGEIEFYIHRRESEWSTLVRPNDMSDWDKLRVPSKPLAEIVCEQPCLVKIDIEGADLMALESLSDCGRTPTHLICEAHDVKVLCKLITMGYTEFRLMNGKRARKKFRNRTIKTLTNQSVPHSFGPHSSGPMDDDLKDPWYDKDQIMYLWSGRSLLYGHGWFDVHARLKE